MDLKKILLDPNLLKAMMINIIVVSFAHLLHDVFEVKFDLHNFVLALSIVMSFQILLSKGPAEEE